MSNRGWQGGSSSRLDTCTCLLHLLHLQANLPSVVGPAQVLRVLRGPPAGLRRPWRPLAGPNTSGVQCESRLVWITALDMLFSSSELSITVHLDSWILAQQISIWCWKS